MKTQEEKIDLAFDAGIHGISVFAASSVFLSFVFSVCCLFSGGLDTIGFRVGWWIGVSAVAFLVGRITYVFAKSALGAVSIGGGAFLCAFVMVPILLHPSEGRHLDAMLVGALFVLGVYCGWQIAKVKEPIEESEPRRPVASRKSVIETSRGFVERLQSAPDSAVLLEMISDTRLIGEENAVVLAKGKELGLAPEAWAQVLEVATPGSGLEEYAWEQVRLLTVK